MFYDKYVRLCNSIKKSPSAVAQEIGFQKSSVTRWKNGSMPTDASLQSIADYFGVTVAYLLREDAKPPAPEGRGGEGADAAAADISEADVRAWLQAHGDELTPDEFVQLFGMGSSDAAILAICQLLPDEQKAALVEMVRSLAKSQGLIE